MVNSILKTGQIQHLQALKTKDAVFRENVYKVLYTLQALVAAKLTPFPNPEESSQFTLAASRTKFLNFSDNGWQQRVARSFPGQ